MAGLMVEPLSLKEIRVYAKQIRTIFGLGEDGYIDIVWLYEGILQLIGVSFEIVSCEEMGAKHGETVLGKNIIRIREDVYERACDGFGRDRLTMAHELGHLLLHHAKNLSLARNDGSKIPAYCDPEWQANAFAGEFLAPYEFIKGKDVSEIARKYGVSYEAAKIQESRRR